MIFIADKEIKKHDIEKYKLPPLWIKFSSEVLNLKFKVFCYEARNTNSIYLFIKKSSKKREHIISIRFSDHQSNTKNYEFYGKPDFNIFDRKSFNYVMEQIINFNKKYFPHEYKK